MKINDISRRQSYKFNTTRKHLRDIYARLIIERAIAKGYTILSF